MWSGGTWLSPVGVALVVVGKRLSSQLSLQGGYAPTLAHKTMEEFAIKLLTHFGLERVDSFVLRPDRFLPAKPTFSDATPSPRRRPELTQTRIPGTRTHLFFSCTSCTPGTPYRNGPCKFWIERVVVCVSTTPVAKREKNAPTSTTALVRKMRCLLPRLASLMWLHVLLLFLLPRIEEDEPVSRLAY